MQRILSTLDKVKLQQNMSENNTKQIWSDVLSSIRVVVSDAIFGTWFSQTHLVSLKNINGRFAAEVGCPSVFVKSTVEARYFGLVQDTLSKTISGICDLVFIIKQNPDTRAQDTSLFPLFEKDAGNKARDNLLLEKFTQAGIRPGFTFDNFAVSSSNQMAWAAAEAVSKEPGTAYNPLFLWGGVGVGKTHLMNAVGHYLIEKDQDSRILSCTGEFFTNDIVNGIRNKTTQKFRDKYRKLGALFVDDIQFIAGKDAVQAEFFHTFNSLIINGSQIILTSDKPPSDIAKLMDRLRSRFEAGLIIDISPPDFELRCAICQIKTNQRELELPMDIVQLIAGNLDSARKIEGFLIKLISQAKLKKTDIDYVFVNSLLGKAEETNSIISKINPTLVITAVSRYFSLGKKALLGSSRTRSVARPRQILMYILRTQLGLPLEEVGNLIGGRDHTTVMHAVEKITQLASNEVQIREDIRGIKNLL